MFGLTNPDASQPPAKGAFGVPVKVKPTNHVLPAPIGKVVVKKSQDPSFWVAAGL
jgi:hypothetical protein